MIKKIFLDVDGVLVNFRKGIFNAFGVPCSYETASPAWEFWNEFIPTPTFKEVNDKCNMEFWKNLDWMHDGFNILAAVELYFPYDIIWLLTAPMPNLESDSGKIMWVHNNLPMYEKKTIITRAPKCIFATPETLLIDDNNENIVEFVKAGGRGILVPRPWNELHERARETEQVVINNLVEML